MAIVTLRLMPTQEGKEEEHDQESGAYDELGEPWAQCTSTACECSFAFSASRNIEGEQISEAGAVAQRVPMNVIDVSK